MWLVFLRLILPDPVWTPAICIKIFSIDFLAHLKCMCIEIGHGPLPSFSFAGCHVYVMSSHTNADWLSIIKWHVTQLSEYLSIDTRAVRKVPVHFEYLENRSRGLEVTWKPETLRCICEQSISCGASQLAVRRCWLSLCTVWLSHSQIFTLSTVILALGRARSRREPNLGCREADRPGWCDVLPKKSLHKSCRMDRRIVVMKLICSLGHCECDGHTVHKLSQRRLTADWLAPGESDCSRMHSKVSSDWLPSYIKATLLVLRDIQNGWILYRQPTYI